MRVLVARPSVAAIFGHFAAKPRKLRERIEARERAGLQPLKVA